MLENYGDALDTPYRNRPNLASNKQILLSNSNFSTSDDTFALTIIDFNNL